MTENFAGLTQDDLRALLESAHARGVTLRDFASNPRFSPHFKNLNLPLLSNKVPVLPGSAAARTTVEADRRHRDRPAFKIRLPAYIDFFPGDDSTVEPNRNITLYKALLIQEAAHIAEGSIEPLDPSRLFEGLKKPWVARSLYRHCVESTRSVKALTARFPHRVDFIRCLNFYHMNTIGIRGRYTGCLPEDFLPALERRLACGTDMASLIAENPLPRLAAGGTRKTLKELLHEESLFLASPLPGDLASRGFRTAGELLDHMSGLVRGMEGKSVADSVRLTMKFHDLLLPLSIPDSGSGGPDGGLSNHLRPARCFFQGSLQPKTGKELDEMENEILGRVKDIAALMQPGPNMDLLFTVEKGPSVQGTLISEYDESGAPAGTSRVILKRLETGDPSLISKIRGSYPGVIGSITEQFLNLKLNRLQVLRMQRSPESLNPAGLVYAVIDDNFARQQRFYDASLRNRRSYAVYHLIDASGSTSACLNPARPSVVDPGRDARVLDVEKIAAASIFTAIEDLDLRESFTQKMFLYQSHGDTYIYEATDVSSLAGLEPDLANRDGAAVRSVTSMLAAESNDTKVIFIFADGMPSDHNYSNGIHDTAMAIKEAVDNGVKVFYILTKNTTFMSSTERKNFNCISRFATDRKIVYDPSQLPFKTRDLFTSHLI